MSEEQTKKVELYPTGASKKPWQSKTLWANIVMALVAFFPGPIQDFATPENIGTLFLVVNTVLRFVTKSGVSLT